MKTTPIITTIMALALGSGPLLARGAAAADKPAAKKATVAPLAAAGTCDSTGLLYPTKPKREMDPNSGPRLDRPLPGEDPHTMAPLPAERGMGAPVPDGIDLDKVPGRDGPDREPPPMGTGYWAWYGYHQSEARSDISCRPWIWGPATTAKVGAWGSTPAPGLESDSCADTRFRMVREEAGRKGGDGKETGGTGGSKDSGGSGGGTDNDNTGGSADNENTEAADNQNTNETEEKKDPCPEGDDPDEWMSPASAEIAEALAALAGFDLRGGGSSEGGGESEAEKELERRRRSQPGPGVSPGDGVDPEDGQPDELETPVGADGKIDWSALGHAASPAVGNPGDPPKPIGPRAANGNIGSAAMGHAASPVVGDPGEPPRPPQPPRPHTDATPAMATVMAVRGTAQRLSLTDGQATWVPVEAGDKLSRFDVVRTGLGAGLDLEVGDAGRISIGSATKLGVGEIGGSEGAVHLNLKYGSVRLAKATNVGAMQVQTPTGTARLTKGRGTVRFTGVRGLKVLGAAQRVATAKLSGQGLQNGNMLGGGNAMRPTLSAGAPAAGQAPAVMTKTPRVAGIVR